MTVELVSTTHRHSCYQIAHVEAAVFREAKGFTCPRGCGAHWCKQCNRTFERGGIHSCDGQAELGQLLQMNKRRNCPGMYC